VRSHAIGLPKKVRRLALKTALSSKLAEGKLKVVDALTTETPKTAALGKTIDALGWSRILFIGGSELDVNFQRAAANLIGVKVMPQEGANVYDILRCDTLVLTRAAVEHLEARLK
jgi:large subunit ribosomal protein L4